MTTETQPSDLERLKQEVQHEHQMYLRALADFDNYRRRVERERTSAAHLGKRDLVLSLVDLLDGFDRALPHLVDAPSAVSDGVQALHRQLLALLEAQGVKPFSALGEPFDPGRHEAVGSEESDEAGPGTVTAEVRRGYRWGDELLRPAQVRVAR
jgi:molecular chaperone GrpE